MNNAVYCNACGKDFAVTVARQRQFGDVIFKYITCPHCETAFLSDVTDAGARRLFRKYKECGLERRRRAYLNQIVDEQITKYRPLFEQVVPNAYHPKEGTKDGE